MALVRVDWDSLCDYQITHLARGHWRRILIDVGGLDAAFLDRKPHTCPKCGGIDQFQCLDVAEGRLVCHQCLDQNHGIQLDAVSWLTGWDRPTTVKAVGKHLGVIYSEQRARGNRAASENEMDFTSILDDAGRTDIANARRFIDEYGPDFQFCHAWGKPLVWDGRRWKIDDDDSAIRMAIKVADKIWHEVSDRPKRETLEFADKTSKRAGINTMIRLAGSMRSVTLNQLDAEPWLLNCLNGTIDLRTGQLREHRREDNLTKLVPTNFNPEATSDCWDRFLETTFPDRQMIDFVQRLCGYFLTGDVSEQILTVFYGDGSNGKSTILHAVQETLGTDYSCPAPPGLLVERNTEAHPTEMATLFAQRLVIAQETSQGAKLAESTIKQLTGGDLISARRMREDFWTFAPTHKLVLCTNHKPQVKGTDHAIWRRIVLIPFAQTFWNPAAGESGPPELEQDRSLAQKLSTEREAILAWMVRGCLEWQRSKLPIPDQIKAATAEYRSENDTVGRFVTDRCLVDEAVKAKFSEIYTALSDWCGDVGRLLPSRKFVGEWLKVHGFVERKSGVIWYRGITLKSDVSV